MDERGDDHDHDRDGHDGGEVDLVEEHGLVVVRVVVVMSVVVVVDREGEKKEETSSNAVSYVPFQLTPPHQ